MHHRYDDSVSLKFQLSEHSIVESIDSEERYVEEQFYSNAEHHFNSIFKVDDYSSSNEITSDLKLTQNNISQVENDRKNKKEKKIMIKEQKNKFGNPASILNLFPILTQNLKS